LQFVILLAIPAVMYFVLIRPQKKRQREQAAIMSAIDIGDEVVTTSGIYGFVTGKEDDMFWLEIDENVQIRIAKAAIQGKVGGDTATPAVESDSASKDPGKQLGKESSKEAPIDTTAGDDTDDKPDKK
jgi:preprotein translocase subunit YajC